MKPQIIKPFAEEKFKEIQEHIKHIRMAFDWPGMQLHDSEMFNRWQWHNLPLLKMIHHDPNFIKLASETFGQPVKPSYVFLSMYNEEGFCPIHRDRPQCQFTIDLCINQDKPWPIFVENGIGQIKRNELNEEGCDSHILQIGEALAYSGTNQTHFRKPMKDSEFGGGTFIDLAFFHFVPTSWMGEVK